MINLCAENGKYVYGIAHYVVNTAGKIKDLPTNCAMGSEARVLATRETYILNGNKNWVL